MEYEDKNDPRYVERFNYGYAVARHFPELSNQLAKSKSQSAAFLAMQDGRQQFLDDQLKERLPAWLNRDPHKSQTRLLGKGKDRSNEPER